LRTTYRDLHSVYSHALPEERPHPEIQ